MSVRSTVARDMRQFSNVETVKLIASFLLSYPLAGVLKRIPDAKPHQKNFFTIA